jgi:sec-independent protein translocase protein TatA
VNLPGGWELVLVLLVVLVVFGSKRLPDSARSLGRSLRIFKAETKGLREDGAGPDKDAAKAPDRPAALPAAEPRFDPYTGKPLDQASGETDR